MRVTTHAKKRLRERKGTKGDCDAVAQRALTEGISYKDATGRLHRYLTALYHRHGDKANVRIYGNNTYIFQGAVLVTVLPLPQEYQRVCKKIRGRKEQVSGARFEDAAYGFRGRA